MTVPLELGIEIVLVLMLATAIYYGVRIQRQLGNLRKDKAELENLAAVFSGATLRAEESIKSLKDSADALQDSLTAAQTLRDDLSFLVERASAAADQLEEKVRSARKDNGLVPVVAADKPPAVRKGRTRSALAALAEAEMEAAADDPSDSRSEAERELLKALRAAR